MKGRNFWLTGLSILPVCFWTWGSFSLSQTIPKDAGLVTFLTGKITYWDQEARVEKEAESFMKVRVGDKFRLEEGAVIRIVFFEGSTQETWKGPATFRIGERGSEQEGGWMGRPEIVTLPPGTGQKIEKVPSLLRKAGLARAGGLQVRGAPYAQDEKESPGRPPYDQEEIQAKYREMRLKAAQDDITPELFLLGALFEQERYKDMRPVLEEAKKRRPDNTVLRNLELWLETRK